MASDPLNFKPASPRHRILVAVSRSTTNLTTSTLSLLSHYQNKSLYDIPFQALFITSTQIVFTMNTFACDQQTSPLGSSSCGSLPSSQNASPVSCSSSQHGQNRTSFSCMEDESMRELPTERASKRQRISSPPRPSLHFRRFHSSNHSLPQHNDPSMPPDIQRLSLPSLLHAGDDMVSASGSGYGRNMCPFGTR